MDDFIREIMGNGNHILSQKHYLRNTNEVELDCSNQPTLGTFEDGKALYEKHKDQIDAILSDPKEQIYFKVPEGMTIESGAFIEGLIGPHLHNSTISARLWRLSFPFGVLSDEAMAWTSGRI